MNKKLLIGSITAALVLGGTFAVGASELPIFDLKTNKLKYEKEFIPAEQAKTFALNEVNGTVEVVSFSTNLEFHSVREEDILFRMMEVYLRKNGGPIAVMEYEHEQANGFINTFLSKTENQSLTPEEIIENTNLIKDAYHTLLDHFMKEEQVLYPMAEKLFSEEEKELFKQTVSSRKELDKR